jgi:hypothetical protein
VQDSNFDTFDNLNLNVIINERSQIIETAVPEARQGLERKGK